MPTVLRKDGYRFFFYSKEGREPPHIHVIGHGGEMKIWLEDITVAKVFNLSPARQRKVIEIIDNNKQLLLSKWRSYHE